MRAPVDAEVAEQRARLDAARTELARTLDDAARAATKAARTARTRRGARDATDLYEFYAASRAVERAETEVDIAATDLAGAMGEDV